MVTVRVGNAPCSWGVMGGYDRALYPPYGEVLDEIAASGYRGTELGDWGFLPTDAARLRYELESRDLSMIGALVPIVLADRAAHGQGRDNALRTARLLAAVADDTASAPFLILADSNGSDAGRVKKAGRITLEDGLTADQWQSFADGANEIARAVRDETGLRTVFHHHCAGFVETPEETAHLMAMTDADLIGLCFDTGHWALGGGDPLAVLREYGSRIWHVHFKEYHAAIHDRMCEEDRSYFDGLADGVFHRLGTGDIDFPAVLSELGDMGYDGWILVEDEMPPGVGNPRERAQADREYLRSLGI